MFNFGKQSEMASVTIGCYVFFASELELSYAIRQRGNLATREVTRTRDFHGNR